MTKKIVATICAIIILAVIPISASAETTYFELYKPEISKTSTILGLYKNGSATLKTDTTSNDGVNLYLDYSIPGSGWKNAKHIFAEPRNSATAGTFTISQASSWRGVMNSWWYNGKNCRASGTVTACN